MELNPISCARHIIATKGPRGLFLGLGANVIRDTPSFGIFFLTYELLCQAWGVRDSLPGLIACMASAIYALVVTKHTVFIQHVSHIHGITIVCV